MNERSIILKAINNKKTHTPPVNEDVLKDIGCTDKTDALRKITKRKLRKVNFQNKNIDDWCSSDFVNYLDFLLKEFKVFRTNGNTRYNANVIDKTHDILAQLIKVKMSNTIFKEYIEWWCSIWAPRMTGVEIFLNQLSYKDQIQKFASRYQSEEKHNPIVFPPSVSSVNDQDIYDLGGLGLLLMKRGLVIGYSILKEKQVKDPASEIQRTLYSFTLEAVHMAWNMTIKLAPYSAENKIDFVSLTKPVFERLGTFEHSNVDFGQYFRS